MAMATPVASTVTDMAVVQATDTEGYRPADMSPMVTAVDSKAATAATGIASAETVAEASAATAADFTVETVDFTAAAAAASMVEAAGRVGGAHTVAVDTARSFAS